jgi:hypothetical protein
MTAYQLLVARLRGGGSDAGGVGEPSWDDAPAPALVARRLIEGVFRREVPPSRIGLLTNATHWAYGTAWGGAYGVLRDSVRLPAPSLGALFGLNVWGTSYLTLVPMGIYRPPWRYPPAEIGLDVSYHLVYGAGVAGAYRVAAPPR